MIVEQIKELYKSCDWKANPWYIKPLEWCFFGFSVLAHLSGRHDFEALDGETEKCLFCGKVKGK